MAIEYYFDVDGFTVESIDSVEELQEVLELLQADLKCNGAEAASLILEKARNELNQLRVELEG